MKNKGITLVALVVTIIIMLILAGVALRITLGDNGLFKMARNSVKAYEESSQKEEGELDNILEDMNHMLPEDAGKEVEVPKKEKGKWDLAKVTPVADGKGNAIPVPKGFYYAGGNIDTGFVISSASGDDLNNSKGGNQFVWIPCTAKQYTDAIDDVMEFNWSSNTYRDNGDDNYTGTDGKGSGKDWSDNYNDEDKSVIDAIYQSEGVATLPTNMWVTNQTEIAETSLEKYGGFYIARFEAGVPEGIPFYSTTSTYNTERGRVKNTTSIKDYKPVSQKGVQVWNWITQPNSKMIAENMYRDYASVGSYLVDTGAWNVICNLFNGILGTSDNQRTITNSTKFGNYYNNTTTNYTDVVGLWAKHGGSKKGYIAATKYETGPLTKEDRLDQEMGQVYIELPTGASDDFEVYNIYDMAGNVWECTIEHNTKNKNESKQMFIVTRGGAFNGEGATIPLVKANGFARLDECFSDLGFRVVLYIK